MRYLFSLSLFKKPNFVIELFVITHASLIFHETFSIFERCESILKRIISRRKKNFLGESLLLTNKLPQDVNYLQKLKQGSVNIGNYKLNPTDCYIQNYHDIIIKKIEYS